ncbi:Uncharacterised protein [Streptococcus pneumoniae]|nr:Uncharacterised protein [Streptococcus pneumoniae]
MKNMKKVRSQDMGAHFVILNLRYSKMKQEQDKTIGTVKSIFNNVLEVEVYYSSFNLL